MSDYRENIREASIRYGEALAGYLAGIDDDGDERDPMELVNEFLLEATVWRADGDRRRVEFLLTVGGPTISVDVNEYDQVTFHHSWGMDALGQDRTDCDVWAEDAAPWVELAEILFGA